MHRTEADRRYGGRSIRTRLALAFVLVVLLPTGVISTVVAFSGAQGAQTNLSHQLDLAASIKEQAIATWVAETELQLAGSRPGVEGAGALAQLTEAAQGAPSAAGRVRVQERLRRALGRASRFRSMVLWDQDGRLLATTAPELAAGLDGPALARLLRGLDGPRVMVVRQDGASTLVAAKPLVDSDGRVLAMLGGPLNLVGLQAILDDLSGLGQTGRAYLVDQDGYLLSGLPGIRAGTRLSVSQAPLSSDPGVHVSMKGTSPDGVPVNAVYRWLPALKAGLMTEQDQAETARINTVLLAVYGSVALASALVALFAAMSITHHLSAPLIDLSETADEIAAGNLEVTASVAGSGEIGALARSFNTMTGKLRQMVVGLREKQAELEHYQEHLEDLIEQRTRSLGVAYRQLQQDIIEREQAEREKASLQARLQQAKKMESLGQLSAGVAHHINNVLAVIMGTASMRETLATHPSDLEAYRIIGKVCRRGRDVVKSLVQFSRPALSNPGPFRLHQVIQEASLLLGNTTRNRLRITSALAPEPLWVHGDAAAINHSIWNLCMNALDAMPEGGTLTFRTAAAGPDWLDLWVEDQGHGMAPEVLEHVLEPFFTTKEVDQGNGLGLSMTYGVVKAHGGNLEIASQPGVGTSVRLRLPRIPAPPEVQEAPPRPSPLGASKVLLVDDDEDVRILMTRMLKKAGMAQVRAVASGEAALQSLAEGDIPDLVILDQNMPGLTGEQTLERIRLNHPRLPILISSGQPDIETWPCFQRPLVAVIAKPFDAMAIEFKLAQFAREVHMGCRTGQ